MKKLKEYDEKILFYTKEKEKLKLIISAITNEPSSSSKNPNCSADKVSKKKDTLHELEEKLDIVVDKYNCLSMKYDIKFNDLENLKVSHKELRDKCYNFKNKYEGLIKINNELKEKLIETEKDHLLQQEEFKSLVKKNSFLSKKVEVRYSLY
jgi:chromosome segregation ATPase